VAETKRPNSKRAQALRAESRELLREKLVDAQTLVDITRIESLLIALGEDESPNTGRVSAYKAALDSKWKRISHVLPALKQIEANIEQGGAFTFQMIAPDD
jgi:hypothetical protein